MTPSDSDRAIDLNGYAVLVCVCGGVAAYKVCYVVSELAQRGAEVTVSMTASAMKFVGQMSFQALSGRRVLTSLWEENSPFEAQHIGITERADLVVIAPATANMIGKLATGIADDLVSTLVISAASPVLLAPAMNNRMWEHPAVTSNVQTLREMGYQMVGPGEGWLACRNVGLGRMAEPVEIIERAAGMLSRSAPKRGTG